MRRCVRDTAAAAIGVPKTQILHVHAGSLEALSLKKTTTVWWPRRDRKGQRLYRQDFSHGGGSCSTPGRTAVAGIQDPGPVRRENTNRSRRGEAETTLKDPGSPDSGSKSQMELLTRQGAEGTWATIPGTRDREAGSPPIYRHGASDQMPAPGRKEDAIEAGDEK